MQKQYYISFEGSHIGPYSIDAIVSRIQDKKSQWTDYVYDEAVGEWVMLLEHPEFASKNTKQAPSNLPAAHIDTHKLGEKEWFVLKEGNNYGPYSKLELIQMLQERSLYEYDYVWHQGMSAWMRVAELTEFSKDSIRDLKESSNSDVSEIFFRRRHARARYGASLIVHNSKAVFSGRTIEISEGGAGVMIESPDLQPGQTVFLHFQPGDGVPPFNAVCQIVSKQFVREPATASKIRYGVKFTSISHHVRESILHFTSKAA
jgi:hypothetical protein